MVMSRVGDLVGGWGVVLQHYRYLVVTVSE